VDGRASNRRVEILILDETGPFGESIRDHGPSNP